MNTTSHITRKRLEQDATCGALTLKIEQGIRSYLHGTIQYEVFDDLVQQTWLRLLKLSEDQRTTQKAYNCGRRAAERYWDKEKRERERTQDTYEEVDGEYRDTLDNMAEPELGVSVATDMNVNLTDYLSAAGEKVLGKQDYKWLLEHFITGCYKSKQDENRAVSLISRLKPALCGRGVIL